MGLFKKLFPAKNPESVRYRREMAMRVSGQAIKYVTERIDNVEEVVGRQGALNVRDDILIVFSSADVVFRCPVPEVTVAELMSHDGVVITGPDYEHEGKERTIVAHYVYYRK